MEDSERAAPITFSGRLEVAGREVCLRFQARVVEREEVEFDFEHILDPVARSALAQINQSREACRLIGTAEDGTSIDAPNFYIISFGPKSSPETGNYVELSGMSSFTILRYRLTVPAEKPLIRLYLKGFRHYPSSHESCQLGTIQIRGATSLPEADIISGVIELEHDMYVPILPDGERKQNSCLNMLG